MHLVVSDEDVKKLLNGDFDVEALLIEPITKGFVPISLEVGIKGEGYDLIFTTKDNKQKSTIVVEQEMAVDSQITLDVILKINALAYILDQFKLPVDTIIPLTAMSCKLTTVSDVLVFKVIIKDMDDILIPGMYRIYPTLFSRDGDKEHKVLKKIESSEPLNIKYLTHTSVAPTTRVIYRNLIENPPKANKVDDNVDPITALIGDPGVSHFVNAIDEGTLGESPSYTIPSTGITPGTLVSVVGNHIRVRHTISPIELGDELCGLYNDLDFTLTEDNKAVVLQELWVLMGSLSLINKFNEYTDLVKKMTKEEFK